MPGANDRHRRVTFHALHEADKQPQIHGEHKQQQQVHFHAGETVVEEGRAAVAGDAASSAVSSSGALGAKRSRISTGTDLANRTLMAVVCVGASGLPFEGRRGFWGKTRGHSFIGCGRV